MLPDDIIISPATIDDMARILEIQKKAFQSEALIYKRHDLLPLTQTIDSVIRDFGSYIYLKAEYNAKIIGSVRVMIENNTCLIGRLIVDPDFQNRGVGRKLMDQLETLFKDVERFELFTGKKSEKNIAFYTNGGYKIVDEYTGEDLVVLVKMVKENPVAMKS